MSKTKYTRGPWLRRKEWKSDKHKLEIWAEDPEVESPCKPCAIAMVSDIHDNCLANARLIAAAPELLDALEKLVRLPGDYDLLMDAEFTFTEARATIAKAKGESQ